MKHLQRLFFVAAIVVLLISACGPAKTAVPTLAPTPTQPPVVTEVPTIAPTEVPVQPFVFGMLLVGPYNDHGWSQAHYEAAKYVEERIPGSKFIYIDKVNPADHPGTTAEQLAEELVSQGAQLVIFNSDDMKADSTAFAKAHPEVFVIMASGDQVWADGQAYEAIPNMTNIMGRMEYGKMMAGCAAALTTQTGQIGYLGPLINDETRRLASSVYLGAKYCWTKAGKDPAALKFKVTWIGFWFNIPGFTSDPTQVADEFFNSGYDVVISGIDTTEALVEAKKFAGEGKQVWAIPYDFIGSCEEGAEICLGVPYFNWGPAYLAQINTAVDGTWVSNFQWNAPDWTDLNNADTTAVGFVKGAALSADAATALDAFIAELAAGLNLWTGPINLQDGTEYLADGVVATDQQIWYLPQLLEGMEGQSVSQ
jgi:simple sugar transport system substrate-binding protein